MKSAIVACALLICSIGHAAVEAVTYTDDVLTLQIPADFEGPVKHNPSPSASAVAYAKSSADGSAKTLLQISTYDFGSQLDGMPEAQRAEITESYLLQFLSGVERRRASFTKSSPTQLTLGGILASRIDWTGTAEGTAASGTMYCVVAGTRVISFHVQTSGEASSPAVHEAKQAIESVRFRNKD